MGLLAILGEHYLRCSARRKTYIRVRKIGIEFFVEILVRIEDSSHPTERAGPRRCDADFLGKHVQVAAEILVGVMISSRVPIAVLASLHLVVGADAGELRSAQVEVGRQIGAVVGVVDAGFGAGTESCDIRKDWIEAPTRD